MGRDATFQDCSAPVFAKYWMVNKRVQAYLQCLACIYAIHSHCKELMLKFYWVGIAPWWESAKKTMAHRSHLWQIGGALTSWYNSDAEDVIATPPELPALPPPAIFTLLANSHSHSNSNSHNSHSMCVNTLWCHWTNHTGEIAQADCNTGFKREVVKRVCTTIFNHRKRTAKFRVQISVQLFSCDAQCFSCQKISFFQLT